MPRTRLLFAALLAFGLWAAAGQAEDAEDGASTSTELPVLIDAIRANRKALVAVNLGLSEEEAAKFWPLYDRYQAAIDVSGDKVAAVVEEYIENYRTLSDEGALELIEAYLAAEADRAQVRRTFVAEFAKILPGRTVARFYQIENKMDAVLRYDLAATIPVVEEAPR